jgi:DNA-binding transcriptional MerR regulator
MNKFYDEHMATNDPGTTQRTDTLLSVGEVAEHLGVPASTLRTWERRYELGPSARSAGGHRRYDPSDVDRLERMNLLVNSGLGPAAAARAALSGDPVERGQGADAFADAVVTATRAYDADGLRTLFARKLDELGTLTAWTDHIAPSMRRIGEEWYRGSIGVDGEHLVSDALHTALRARFASRRLRHQDHRPVLLACAEEEHHVLPLLALQCALAEENIGCHMLGQRTPFSAIAGMTIRLEPAAVFLWASIVRFDGKALSTVLDAADGRTEVLLGGPGWNVDGGRVVADLGEAVEAVKAALDAHPQDA